MCEGGRAFTSEPLCRRILWGAEATVALVAVVGLISLVAFDQLFLLFHQVSFANDFWQLDPRRDFLVMMFPEGFWLDATFFVAYLTIGGAAVLAVMSGRIPRVSKAVYAAEAEGLTEKAEGLIPCRLRPNRSASRPLWGRSLA